jgi:hypothetical protein
MKLFSQCAQRIEVNLQNILFEDAYRGLSGKALLKIGSQFAVEFNGDQPLRA